jgi:hypothetical protein
MQKASAAYADAVHKPALIHLRRAGRLRNVTSALNRADSQPPGMRLTERPTKTRSQTSDNPTIRFAQKAGSSIKVA